MEPDEFLRSVMAIWESQIELCAKRKKTQFGETADELWSFLGKSYRQLYLEGSEAERFGNLEGPWYKARINKSAEAVAVLSGFLLSQVPHRLVNPRRPPLPTEIAEFLPAAQRFREDVDKRDQLTAWMMHWWLNYTPGEFNLKRESRTALTEAIVKGRGVLWHEMADSAVGQIPVSYFKTVNGLLIDADAKQLRDAGFIVRESERSVWWLSQQWGIPREKLRALAKSNRQEAIDKAKGNSDAERGHDVCTVYEIWSRVGIGHWLEDADDRLKPLGDALDSLGPYIWLAMIPGMEHPLNIGPEHLTGAESSDEMKVRLQWPIPFYADMAGHPWPCSVLDFRPNAEDPWATSILQPGLPMQIFLDHLYSFIMSRVRTASRNIVVVAKSLEEELKAAIERGLDLQIVGASGNVQEVLQQVGFVQFPELNKDLWQVVAMVEQAYERATGLEPLLYGAESGRQIRSAREAGIREAYASARPDDYADLVEDWLSDAAAKEAQAARLYVGPEIIAPLCGEPLPEEEVEVYGPLTQAWMELVMTEDPYQAAAEFTYTVEAGMARRKNKAKQVEDVQQLVQVLLPSLFQYGATTGDMRPFNAILEMVGQSLEVPMDRLMLPDVQLQMPETQNASSSGKPRAPGASS